MEYLILAGYAFLSVTVLWIFFLAVMSLDKANAEGKLTTLCKPFAYVILFLGLLIDLFCQIFIFTFLMLDIPRELTVSERLTRYKDHDNGWRNKFAIWFAKHFLDPFDRRGKHI